MAIRVLIAEASAAIDEKTRVKEDLAETIRKNEKESRRLAAELEKMRSMKAEEKPEEDADLAVIQSEIALLKLNALREYVKEEEKETQDLRDLVETMKLEVERLSDEQAAIRLGVNEKTSFEPQNEKQEEEEEEGRLDVEIADLNERLRKSLHQLTILHCRKRCHRSDSAEKLAEIDELRKRKETLTNFPESCPQARILQKNVQMKKRELAELTDRIDE